MYKALYRTWRPQVFDDVVGQSHIVTTLKNEVKRGKVAHSYLFTGSRGTGKTTCSKILAKAVNCLAPQEGNPCGKCAVCLGVDNGSLTDVVEIDAASNNSVEDVRDLREEVRYHPAEAKYRVYIIDEAHMLSKGAFNALLKIMEEPPEYVLFILATTEVHKVPATIISRCQRFDFLRVRPDDIAGYLLHIAEKEGFGLEEAAARLIGVISDGGVRDAISLLDQCTSVTDAVDTATVNQVAGLADRKYIGTLVEAVIDEDCEEVLRQLDHLYTLSIDLKFFTENLVAHFRDLMIVKSMKAPGDLLVRSDEEIQELKSQSKRMNLSSILYAIDLFQDLFKRLSSDFTGKALLETALMKLARPDLYGDTANLAARLERLEKAAASGKLKGNPRKKTARTDTPPQDTEEEAGFDEEIIEDAVQETVEVDGKLVCWPEVLQLLQAKNPPLAATLEDSIAYVKGDLVLIDAPNTVFLDLMRASDATKESLRAAIEDKSGQTFRLGPVKQGASVQEKKGESPLDIVRRTAEENGIPVNSDKEENLE